MEGQRQLAQKVADLQAECDAWEGRYRVLQDELGELKLRHGLLTPAERHARPRSPDAPSR